MTNEIISTDVDRLMALVKKRKEISIQDASKELGISANTIEAWATFLEEEGMLKIVYSFTKPILKYVEVKKIVPEEIRLEGRAAPELKKEKVEVKEVIKKGKVAKVYEIKEPRAEISAERAVEHELAAEEVEQELGKEVKLGKEIKRPKIMKAKPTATIKPVIKPAIKSIKKGVERKVIKEGPSEEIVKIAKKLKAPQRPSEETKILDNFTKLFQQAEAAIAKKRFKTAKNLYSKMKQEFQKLPDKFIEKKREYLYDMIKVNKDLFLGVDKALSYEMSVKSAEIDNILKQVKASIKHDDFKQSKKLLEDAKVLFGKLPTGFLKQRSTMEKKLFQLHDSLINLRIKRYSKIMKAKSREIENLLVKAQAAINKRDVKTADTLFSQIKEIFISLPAGFIKERIALEEKILRLHESLINLKIKYAIDESSHRLLQIESLLNDADRQIAHKKFDVANRLIEKAKQEFKELPEGFLKKKTEVESRLIKTSNNLQSLRYKVETERAHNILKEILTMMRRIDRCLRRKQIDLAHEYYSEALVLYNDIPKGFLDMKVDVHVKLSEFYKRILSASDMELLTKIGPDVNRKYDEMLRLMVQIHKNIEQNDFEDIESIYTKIVDVFNKLPVGFVSMRPKIREEILALHDKIELYNKALQLDKYKDDDKKVTKILQEINYMKTKLRDTTEDKPLLDFVNKKYLLYSKGVPKKKVKLEPSIVKKMEREMILKRKKERAARLAQIEKLEKRKTELAEPKPEFLSARSLERALILEKYKTGSESIARLEKEEAEIPSIEEKFKVQKAKVEPKRIKAKITPKRKIKEIAAEVKEVEEIIKPEELKKKEEQKKKVKARKIERALLLEELKRVKQLREIIKQKKKELEAEASVKKGLFSGVSKKTPTEVTMEESSETPEEKVVKVETMETSNRKMARIEEREEMRTKYSRPKHISLFKKVDVKPAPVRETKIITPEGAASRIREREELLERYGRLGVRAKQSVVSGKKLSLKAKKRAEAREQYWKKLGLK
ncbi:hypothetical protein DRJ17_02930 [Candidatus Woesearchaeota archaeon]|nr:MAG: hypothetical protein DRJ17_02930 [Candidatus Woesearchaeota archaeon]